MIYMLEGVVGYRHGQRIYRLEPGDTLFFDADAPHGPEELMVLADPLSVGDFLCGGRA
jgi:quercetin dioxygenase-like cupin family protein